MVLRSLGITIELTLPEGAEWLRVALGR